MLGEWRRFDGECGLVGGDEISIAMVAMWLCRCQRDSRFCVVCVSCR